jgi:hypothetical protein
VIYLLVVYAISVVSVLLLPRPAGQEGDVAAVQQSASNV